MPNPVSSVTTEVPSDHYDFEQSQCDPRKSPTVADGPAPESAGVSELLASYEAVTQASARPNDCDFKLAKAGITCAQAVLLTLETAPSVVGGLVAGFLSGATCGVALSEAVRCSRQDEAKPR